MEHQKTKAKFREIEHTADVGLIVEGNSLSELFANAAYGMIYLIYGHQEAQDQDLRYFQIIENTTDELLISWLSELNFNIIVNNFTPISIRQLDIKKIDGKYHLDAEISGGRMSDPATEIKAITYHQFYLKKNRENHYQARIIFDI